MNLKAVMAKGVIMVKLFKVLLILVAASLVALAIKAEALGEQAANLASVGFVLVLGTFLGTDVLKMIKLTSLKPAGQFEKFRLWKYLLSLATLIPLVKLSINSGFTLTSGFLIMGAMVVIGSILSGLNANKTATG